MKLRTYKYASADYGRVHVFHDFRYGSDELYDVFLDADPRNAQVFVIPAGRRLDGAKEKWCDHTVFFVMHIDRMRDYVQMARFDLLADWRAESEDANNPVQPTNDVFLEGYQAVDLIGPKGLDYSDMHIAKKLAYYLEETAP